MYIIKVLIIILLFILLPTGSVLAINCGDTTGVAGARVACSCGDTVTTNTTLIAADPVVTTACTGHGLIIGGDNITVNGGGYTITNDYPTNFDNTVEEYGIYSNDKDNVTVTNLTVTKFTNGLYFENCAGSIIRSVTANYNILSGIYLESSPSNLESNIVRYNSSYGMYLSLSPSTLISNTLSDNLRNISISAPYTSTIDTTNLVEGKPILFLKEISNKVYSGAQADVGMGYEYVGDIGMFWCISCDNVTLKNATLSPYNESGIYFSDTTNSTIQNVVVASNITGIYIGETSTGNTITDNIVQRNTTGIAVYSASTVISNNIIDSNKNAVLFSNVSGTFTGNSVLNNRSEFDELSVLANTYASNNFLHNMSSEMISIDDTEDVRAKSVGDVVNFDFSMFNITGTACSDCSVAVTTDPVESSLTFNKVSSRVTGSFTVSKKGIYSLIFTVTDNQANPNTTKRRIIFLVTDASSPAASQTTKYYLRGINPTHAQTPGPDSKSFSLSPSVTTEIWSCGVWIQNTIDEIPLYPFAQLLSVGTYGWYKQSAGSGAYIGMERYGDYSSLVDMVGPVNVDVVAEYTEISQNFTNVNWGMDYPASWYWLALKLNGLSVYWATFPVGNTVDESSYANFTYSYTITPTIKSISNDDINILSATYSSTTGQYSLSLDGTIDSLLSGTGSSNIVLGNASNRFTRPFSGYTTTINSDGTATLQATGITGVTNVSSVSLDITPDTGTIDVTITTWNTSGTYAKEWIEEGTGVTSASHVIGDLKANTYYTVKVNNSVFNTYLSDASGDVTFDYDGGYSTKTFNIEEDVAPTNVGIQSITVDSTAQLTVTATTAVDSGSGLHATPYQFQETSGHQGASSSDWQASSSFSDAGLVCGTEYSYKVRVRDVLAHISDYSEASAATTSGCGGGGLPPGAINPPSIPTGGFSVLIDNNEPTTDTQTVTLTLKAGSDTTKMTISNNSEFTNAIQEEYATTKTWALSDGNGIKIVYVKFLTKYGQASAVVSDSINYTAVNSGDFNYIFLKNLHLGINDPDVVSLKQILASEQCVIGLANTDYFGTKTSAGVKCFQSKYKAEISQLAGYSILGTGYVGIGTRGWLNTNY
ncbi:MAG: right-handed parallel beta-helix repeat-containing protein [Candidatus Staskawiczbacteria bacterium]|jgi:parallel beta-helix repeat protein